MTNLHALMRPTQHQLNAYGLQTSSLKPLLGQAAIEWNEKAV